MSRRQTVLILDFGSQYTQLIARRIREQSVYSEIHPYNIGMELIREIDPSAIRSLLSAEEVEVAIEK